MSPVDHGLPVSDAAVGAFARIFFDHGGFDDEVGRAVRMLSADLDQRNALAQIRSIVDDGKLLIASVDRPAQEAGLDAEDVDYIRALEAKIERVANIAAAAEPDEDWEGYRA